MTGATSQQEFLLKNIGQLLTMTPLAANPVANRELTVSHLGIINQAWMAIKDGKVVATGPMHDNSVETYKHYQIYDAKNALIMPGLIDSHTHPLFAGNRSDEFVLRLQGKSYQDIAAAGGGIRASLAATRACSDQQLLDLLDERCRQMMKWGVTTIETKSGYGLTPEEELRHLKLLNKAKLQLATQNGPLLYVTCLALHAASPEFSDHASYIAACCRQLLPTVARENLADAVDAFIEQGYFSVEDVEPYMQLAQQLGLHIRIHADEFSDAGAASAAGRWGAKSADHLQFASADGLSAMAAAGTVATLLPGTSLYTGIPFTQAALARQAGCMIAIASDFNPGSCYLWNLPMLATFAAIHNKLKPEEVIAGITWYAAKSLGLEQHKGALAPGFDADFSIHASLSSWQQWLADCGQTPPSQVVVAGTLGE